MADEQPLLWWHKLMVYALTPFPNATGFSPYRMPGPSVHLAVMAALIFVGTALCSGAQASWLDAIWIAAGVYLGRDLTVAAHYSAAIAIPGVLLFGAGFVSIVFFSEALGGAWHALRDVGVRNAAVTWAATAAIATAFAARLFVVARSPM